MTKQQKFLLAGAAAVAYVLYSMRSPQSAGSDTKPSPGNNFAPVGGGFQIAVPPDYYQEPLPPEPAPTPQPPIKETQPAIHPVIPPELQNDDEHNLGLRENPIVYENFDNHFMRVF